MKIKDVIIEDAEEIRAEIINKVEKIPDEVDLKDVLRFTNRYSLRGDVKAFSKARKYKDFVSDMFLQALANADIDADTVNKFLNKLNTDGILDEKLLLEIARTHDALVFVEDSAINGGAGSACLEILSENNIQIQSLLLGLPDEYVEHGELSLLLDRYGLSKEKIKQRVLARFS